MLGNTDGAMNDHAPFILQNGNPGFSQCGLDLIRHRLVWNSDNKGSHIKSSLPWGASSAAFVSAISATRAPLKGPDAGHLCCASQVRR